MSLPAGLGAGRTAPGLGFFFAPKTVAVIGASERPGSIGRTLFENMADYEGRVFPVNPRRPAVLGHPAYPRIDDIPAGIDLALLATPAPVVPSLLQACAATGVKAAVIHSAGFRECGPAGAELEREVTRIARRGGIRLLGPNSLGLMAPHRRLNASFARPLARPGHVAFVSQSGALGSAVLDWSLRENVGFSAFVSIGSMADVGWAELLDWLGDDPHTRSILLYIESIGDPRSFLSAARETAFTKPIIAVKVGRTAAGRQAAIAHTGAITGDDEVLDAAFRRAGVLRVDAIEDLFDAAEVLAKQPRPRGPRLTIVTNAGGPAALAADRLVVAGGQLAPLDPATRARLDALLPAHWSHGNPVDILGDADPGRFAATLDGLAQADTSDATLVVLTPQAVTNPTEIARELATFAARHDDKPILASWMGGHAVEGGEAVLNAAGIPTFPFPDRAAQAFNYMVRHSANLAALYETPTLAGPGAARPQTRATITRLRQALRQGKRRMLGAAEARALLAAYGLPTTANAEAPTPGVWELALRSHVDPQFGPVVTFGIGGRAAQMLPARVLALPPLTSTLARQLIEQLRLPADSLAVSGRLAILEQVIVHFSQLVAQERWIERATIDPLLVGNRATAGHVEILAHDPALRADELPRPAIRPYPQNYATTCTLRDGARLHIRPIRPEDEPLMVQFHGQLSDRSIYYRYFTALPLARRIAHARLARLCFVDYDREIALVAVDEATAGDGPRIVGVGRLCRAHGGHEAEFALVIADAWQRRGLGRRLLTLLVHLGRDEGLTRITGTILSENHDMRRLCAHAGFTVGPPIDGECHAAIEL